MNAIGLVGLAGAGKDTVAELLQLEMALYGDVLQKYAFADPIRTFLLNIFRFDAKIFQDRKEKEKVIIFKIDNDVLYTRFVEAFSDVMAVYTLARGYDTVADYLYDRYMTGNGGMDKTEAEFYVSMYQIFRMIFSEYEVKVPWYIRIFGKLSYTVFKMSPRTMMQKVGTELFRANVDYDFWTVIAPASNVIYTDVRFENEAQFVKTVYGTLVKIDNKLVTNKMDHVSESYIDNIVVDDNVNNSGDNMDQLINEVEDLARRIYAK